MFVISEIAALSWWFIGRVDLCTESKSRSDFRSREGGSFALYLYYGLSNRYTFSRLKGRWHGRTRERRWDGRWGWRDIRRICLEQRLLSTDGISKLAFAGNTPSASLSFFLLLTTTTTTTTTTMRTRSELKAQWRPLFSPFPVNNTVYLTSFKSTKPVN